MKSILRFSVMPAVALATFSLASGLLAGTKFGRFAVGEDSYFKLLGDGARVRTENGETLRWSLPSTRESITQIETGAGDDGFVPYAVTDSARLYRGNKTTRTWTLVTDLPGVLGAVNQSELLVADIFKSGRLFWSFDRTVWISDDGGSSWNMLSNLPNVARRTVYTLDGDLVVFTQDGRVMRGPVETDSNGSIVWNSDVGALFVSPNEDAFVLQNGDYFFVDRSTGARQWRVQSQGAVRGSITAGLNSFLPKEFSTANATTSGCGFEVYRWTSKRQWQLDNFWDVGPSAAELLLRVVLTKGTSQCVFNAPFDPHRIKLRAVGSSQAARTGWPGDYFLDIEENDYTDPLMRAIGFHVSNKDYYKEKGVVKPVDLGDKWAIVLQNHVGGGTACQALKAAATANPGRLTLTVDVVGSDSYCPITKAISIACTSPATSSGAKSVPGARASTISGINSMADTSGAGECSLPEIR